MSIVSSRSDDTYFVYGSLKTLHDTHMDALFLILSTILFLRKLFDGHLVRHLRFLKTTKMRQVLPHFSDTSHVPVINLVNIWSGPSMTTKHTSGARQRYINKYVPYHLYNMICVYFQISGQSLTKIP